MLTNSDPQCTVAYQPEGSTFWERENCFFSSESKTNIKSGGGGGAALWKFTPGGALPTYAIAVPRCKLG